MSDSEDSYDYAVIRQQYLMNYPNSGRSGCPSSSFSTVFKTIIIFYWILSFAIFSIYLIWITNRQSSNGATYTIAIFVPSVVLSCMFLLSTLLLLVFIIYKILAFLASHGDSNSKIILDLISDNVSSYISRSSQPTDYIRYQDLNPSSSN